jgi:hypothetical protein
VPIVYRGAEREECVVTWSSGEQEQVNGATLGERASRGILGRTGEVRDVVVSIVSESLAGEVTP